MKKKLLTWCLTLLSIAAFAQTRTITGKIIGSAKDTLAGVVVKEKGTSNGTLTDANGNFSLVVADTANVTLQLSAVGFRDKEVKLGTLSSANLTLEEDAELLDDVVIVGYGTQKASSISGAIATFKADNLEERPVARVDQALVGQMAGVQVKQTSGAPGKAMSIQVRGAGSISGGNEPLYVLDGFPLSQSAPGASGSFATNPLDNINPNDIESIQVLKDASAAAIYGSRAANGVVIITTKKGKSGKPQLNFNVTSGFSQASKRVKMMDGDQWINRATEMINAQWVASGTGRTASQTTEQRRQILNLPAGGINPTYMLDDRWAQPGRPGLQEINWQDEIFRTGFMQNYQLSASGATDYMRYYISGNVGSQDGFVKGMDFTNYSARANVEVTPNKKFKFGINLAPTFSIRNDPGVEGKDGILHQAVSFSPIQEASSGLHVNTYDNAGYIWSNSLNSSVDKLTTQVGENKLFRTLATTYLNYEVLPGLVARTTVNLDNADNTRKTFIPYTLVGTLASRQGQPGVNTSGTYSAYRNQTFVNENTLGYSKKFKEVHNLSVLAGHAYTTGKIDNVNIASTGGYANSSITTLNAATGITGPASTNTSESKNVLISYFGRVQYDYAGKYLLSASLRRDGSSRFGANNKWGYFPSASAAWRISSEKFMAKTTKIMNDLKLRASWGRSGNYNIGDYSSISTLGFSNYTYNGALATGQAPNILANPDLSWEKTETFNYGVDMGFFKNRITFSADYYTKRSTDLLLNVPVLQSTGFVTSLSNVGEVLNKGWELELTSNNVVRKSFSWKTSANLTHNKNEVIALGKGQTKIELPSSFDISNTVLQVGDQMNSIYVVQQDGYLTAQDIADHAPVYGTQTVGDPKYVDANGDNKIDANDRVVVGHPNPNYIFGLTNTVKYKGFDLSVLVQGQQGGSVYSLFGRAINRTGQGSQDNTLAENEGTKYYSTFGRIVNTDWLYSSDYLSIRSIVLGYDLKKVIKSEKIQAARFYVSLENYFSWNKYKGGFNPEASNTDLSGSAVFPNAGDYGGLPLAKSLIFGLNITF
ncbi:SusC/RagA family TonB-linked outer membrane protein [Sphingobacteriaceae bacterium]|nr:SusC/RagA family TonB-linked outer membrane protein [Sphingobacteriaceae bacterium]